MKLQTASRKRTKIRLLLQGPSGSGKTMGALKIAEGLVDGQWNKIAVIDTENQSADLYSHLGSYNVLHLSVPFTPESYIEALDVCEKAGMEVIVIDSISHSWEYLLDYHSSLPGNSFTNWSKVTPRHNAFVDRILRSSAHIITTVRAKTDYTMVEKNGKQVPEKVGMKGIQRDGVEYEYSLCFELDIKHYATASKDRTSLFMDKPPFRLTSDTGATIKKWCEEGIHDLVLNLTDQIDACKSIQELVDLYHGNPDYQVTLRSEFEKQKQRLLLNREVQTQLVNQKISENGTHHA